MKKSNTNLIFITSIILLVVLTGFSIYFLNAIRNKNRHISAVEITLKKKIEDKQNVSTLQKKMNELLGTNTKIDGYIVDTSRIDLFVEYLEGLGINNNVNLSVKTVDVLKNEKNKIFLGLSINGTFTNVMKTIVLLENSPYNMTTTSSYVNKDIVVPVDAGNGTNKESGILPERESSWQADITFNVLSI
ncbi:MAG: hypothetical protein NTV03_01070 [Candidatus Nomurabacteria bacterium]|nr:hypothetical protein [Candidatus Nomurabacteria bacterium]